MSTKNSVAGVKQGEGVDRVIAFYSHLLAVNKMNGIVCFHGIRSLSEHAVSDTAKFRSNPVLGPKAGNTNGNKVSKKLIFKAKFKYRTYCFTYTLVC